jgi:phenylalanyl-tRNA synthetase beta chain
MNIGLSWLKDYIELDLPITEIATLLNNLGLEVEHVQVVGLPIPTDKQGFTIEGLAWDRQKIVVAEIREVMPHPNADRLVLCKLFEGKQELVILTGAPNLFEYKGKGLLPKPLKVAYAREGARIYDGHQPGFVPTTLKRTTIRGVESFSMVCSEKELGISEEHEGIILLDDDAPVGSPLADYLGDAVFSVAILPNMIRDACILGAARELSAVTGKPLKQPKASWKVRGPSIEGQASIRIEDPQLNPRFVLGLVKGVESRPSPYRVQFRLRLSGMRPINSIVDATNYVMLETGEPLHAFDYDVLTRRAKGKPPTIITRAARKGEKLTTLDDVERKLDDFTILVCDTAGPLSLAGVMGGQESEVTPETRNVLLEGASWNFINTRRTVTSQRLNSEAAYRFARGIHPALAEQAVRLGLDRIASWSGGEIAVGLVDAYPLPYEDPIVELTTVDVERLLGVAIPMKKIEQILKGLEFDVKVSGEKIAVKSPPNRTDIHTGLEGKADVIEEIARLYGYDKIPERRLTEQMPPAHPRPLMEVEGRLRDALVRLGLQEIITYRMTEAEQETQLTPPGQAPKQLEYVRLLNPLTPERAVMRRSLLASVLATLEKNIRLADRLALFEIGPVFLPQKGQQLPEEKGLLALAFAGAADASAWDKSQARCLDFFDLKGLLEGLFSALHIENIRFAPLSGTIFHPGKGAEILADGEVIGMMGELHPLVKERFDFGPAAILTAELELNALLKRIPARIESQPVSGFPPILEDIAIIVNEEITSEQLLAAIRQAGGELLTTIRLFDIFRGEQIGVGKKSMAYNLTYQAPDRTLTDKDAAQIRQRIVKKLEQDLGAKLRSD